VFVLLAGAAMLMLGRLGAAAVDEARATTAADAAALAMAAEEDGDSAERFAEANGGEVVELRQSRGLYEADVRVGERTARARATAAEPVEPLVAAAGGGGGHGTTDGGERRGVGPRVAGGVGARRRAARSTGAGLVRLSLHR
jgi:hypothetical protein